LTTRTFSILTEGHHFLEGLRWHDGKLWMSDFYAHRVMSVDLVGHVETVAEVPGQPSGLGWLPDGRMLVVSMTDKKVMRREHDGTLVVHADLGPYAGGILNDMVVDSVGRAYVGNFGYDLFGGAPLRTTPIIRVDPDGTVTPAEEGLYFPNGSVITPDGKTLIVNESAGNRISAFDILPGGALDRRRDWAVFGETPQHDDGVKALVDAVVAPDGCSLDAEGALWVADAAGNRVIRVAEGGEILEEIKTGDGVYCTVLGGARGTTLFMAAAPNFIAAERKATRLGKVVMTVVDVPRAGLS
jgi:sugar lactone lactonase YvrE